MTDGGTLLPTGLASGRSRALTYPLAGLGAAFALYACLQILFGRLPLLDLGFGRAPVPAGIFAYGAVVGSLYALVAFGLILTYRATRAINFAQAGMGAVPAVGALVLVFARGWPFFAALAAAVVVALALGAVIERQVIRPFEHSPRLVVSVATIGLSLLLAFFEIKVPGWLAGELLTSVRLDTPFSTFTFDIGEFRTVDPDVVARARRRAESSGAFTTLSSVHFHITFDTHDKASGSVAFLAQQHGFDTTAARLRFAYVGDSENDAACFAAFHTTIGVANLSGAPSVLPRYRCAQARGAGFDELAARLLELRS